jgi:transposase, IS5 family
VVHESGAALSCSQIGRHKVGNAAKKVSFSLKQIFEFEAKTLRRRARGDAHAKQFKRLQKIVKRQRTILGVVIREVQRKPNALVAPDAAALSAPKTWLERAKRIRTQQQGDQNKLYALQTPEVECIGKDKARKPYEFGVKVSLAVTHLRGLMVGARSFPGNPFDGHTLAAQLEQTNNLMQDMGRVPKQVITDFGFQGVDADNPNVEIIHRGKYKSLTKVQRKWLKCRQAIEPLIGHTKAEHDMQRCWLQGELGDALHALSCRADYNIRWLLRAIAARSVKYAKAFLLALLRLSIWGQFKATGAWFTPKNSSVENSRLRYRWLVG